MPEPIQIKRRLGGAAGPPPTLDPGELAFNDNGDTLYIGTAVPANVHTLVSTSRFLPIVGGTLAGDLNVGTTTTGQDLAVHGTTSVHGSAGAYDYDSQSTAGAASTWKMRADGATTNSATIFSMGPAAAPLTGTNTPRLTIHANGDVDVAGKLVVGPAGIFPNITATDIAGAINELQGHIGALQAGEQRVAFYDAPSNEVRSPNPGTLTANLPLSAAANLPSPARAGWYLIVMGSGTGVAPIAGATLNPNDRISCDGTNWTHQSMGQAAATASATAFTPVASPAIAGTNVQTAIEQLNTAALRSVVVDATQFSGNGTTGSAITITRIDGGTY